MYQFNLINGEFNPDEAKELLLELYSKEINYYKIKNFSSIVRFSNDDSACCKRIEELKKELSRLDELFNKPSSQDVTFLISSSVEISIRETLLSAQHRATATEAEIT